MKICSVPFWHGQRHFYQRSATGRAGRKGSAVTARKIFEKSGFTFGLHLPDSSAPTGEINQIARFVNGLGRFGGTLPHTFLLARWNQHSSTTSGSSEQRRIRRAQPILPLFVLALYYWLTARCSPCGPLGGTAALSYIGPT